MESLENSARTREMKKIKPLGVLTHFSKNRNRKGTSLLEIKFPILETVTRNDVRVSPSKRRERESSYVTDRHSLSWYVHLHMSDWPRTGVYQFDGPTRCHLAFTRSLAYAPPHQVIARYVRCIPPRSQPEISWLNAIIARVSINYVAVFKWPVSDRARSETCLGASPSP